MPDCSANRLIHSFHAQVFIVLSSTFIALS
uniref:Uncharacterized protein n=1 Tax=Arundo donax TaxID=35708 RepID=A0A0A9HD94_ARUDO